MSISLYGFVCFVGISAMSMYVSYMGMGCVIYVVDYTCYVSVKHTCIDMGDYLRERLYLEGVRRGTPPAKFHVSHACTRAQHK